MDGGVVYGMGYYVEMGVLSIGIVNWNCGRRKVVFVVGGREHIIILYIEYTN